MERTQEWRSRQTSRKTKTISFNLISEYDARLLEFAEKEERGSFSKYIKRLIDDDLRGSSQRLVVANRPVEMVEFQRNPSGDSAEVMEDTEAMSGFL